MVEVRKFAVPVNVVAKARKIKKIVLHQHWHHHFLRGALVMHVTHYMIVTVHDLNTWDGVTDVACGVFVITEYVIACREAHLEECKKETEDVTASQKIAA